MNGERAGRYSGCSPVSTAFLRASLGAGCTGIRRSPRLPSQPIALRIGIKPHFGFGLHAHSGPSAWSRVSAFHAAATMKFYALCALLWPLSATAQDIGAAFATASSDTGSSVTLYTGRGVCVGEARAAMWRPAPGDSREPVPGCWVLTDGVVLVSFLDGERGNIPARLLVKAASL